MTDVILNEARRLQAKNALKRAVYKLKAGTTLQKDDRVVLLAYLNKAGSLLKDNRSVISEKKLGTLTADEIVEELLAAFEDQNHKLTFPIDDESKLEIVLLEATKDNPLFAFRVEVDGWGIAWTVDTLRGAAFVVRRFVQDKELLRGRVTSVLSVTGGDAVLA